MWTSEVTFATDYPATWGTADPYYLDVTTRFVDSYVYVAQGTGVPELLPPNYPYQYLSSGGWDIGGSLVAMGTAWEGVNDPNPDPDYAFFTDQPTGTSELTWWFNNEPLMVEESRLYVATDSPGISAGGWTPPSSITNTYDGITVTPMDAAGSPIGTAVVASTLVQTINLLDVIVIAQEHYGVLIEHLDPGGDNPVGYAIEYVYLERSSAPRIPRPFPSPSGLPGNPRLRQRQTPFIVK